MSNAIPAKRFIVRTDRGFYYDEGGGCYEFIRTRKGAARLTFVAAQAIRGTLAVHCRFADIVELANNDLSPTRAR